MPPRIESFVKHHTRHRLVWRRLAAAGRLAAAIAGVGAALAGCSRGSSAPAATPVAAAQTATAGVATPARACCTQATGASSAPPVTSMGAASAPPATGVGATITRAAGVQTTLANTAASDLEFVRYDLARGMSYSYGFSVADYDGNGSPDLTYFDSYTSARARFRTSVGAIGHMMRNNGDREVIVHNDTFDFQPAPVNPDVFLFERHVPLDVNGDGRLDIVGVANSHGAVVAYLNSGVHNVPWTRRVLSTQTPGAVNLVVADVNGDGRPDLIVAMRDQSGSAAAGLQVGIAWLENTGLATGEWIYHPIDTTPATFVDPRMLQAGDINQDGKIDVVVSDSGTGVVAWYEQSAPDKWIRHEITGVTTFNSHYGRLLDMDGDGQLDILLPVMQGVAWLRNVNRGASWELHPIVQFTDPDWANVVTEVAAGDLHHDGTLDVAFTVGSYGRGPADHRTGGLFIAHPTPSRWSVSQIYTTDNSCVGLQLVDFDGTGVIDIVSNAEYQQNSLTLWKNQLAPQIAAPY